MARIVLGVGGSIAAWKACDLASKLVQAGHTVDVVMTSEAQWFVQPLAFSALTHRHVFTDETWRSAESPAAHLEATREADLMVIAPCTANLIGKMANGIADEIVSATYLGATCPVLIAPAMNWRMWQHARVKANVATVAKDGVTVIGPEEGYLAEAEEGMGRMSEPEGILAVIERSLSGD